MAVLKTDVFKTKVGTYPRWVPGSSRTHILDNAPGPDFCRSQKEEEGCWKMALIPSPFPNILVFHWHQPTWPHVHPSNGQTMGPGYSTCVGTKPCGVDKSECFQSPSLRQHFQNLEDSVMEPRML